MKPRVLGLALSAVAFLPSITSGQAEPAAAAASDAAPVASAFRENYTQMAKNLIAAAEEMPARKYGYKPTKAQMSFGNIQIHLAEANDFLCGAIGGTKAPERSKVVATATKEVLVARLKETFAFCEGALAGIDDSKLGEQVPWFGGRTKSRAGVMTATTGNWSNHYSQEAIYLRLSGLLPPTAKKKPAQ